MSSIHQGIDCHAHIIDPDRFPFVDGAGYRPKPEETGTAEAFEVLLAKNGMDHALLVQPSGYGFDNSAILDAMRRSPGRFKGVAMLDASVSDRTLDDLTAAGFVGIRFNLVSFDLHALDGQEALRFLDRLEERGWFVEIFAPDEHWPHLAALFRKRETKLLIDHFGFRDVGRGTDQTGFQTVLSLGREKRAVIKVSAPYRISRTGPPYSDLDPFATAVLDAFGPEQCMWGSDWPFLDVPRTIRYEETLEALRRWVPNAGDLRQVLYATPARLFRFGDQP